MCEVKISDLQGLGNLPNSRPACITWLQRNDVPLARRGNAFWVAISDLPATERRAYVSKTAEVSGLSMGDYDDDAHLAFAEAAPSLQVEAHRKAEIAVLLLSVLSDADWSDRHSLVRKKFGCKGTSLPSLKRVLKAVEGVQPINFAPALLPA